MEKCRRPDENALVHSRQQEDQRRGDRLVREEDTIHTHLPHKAVVRDQQKKLRQIERERRQLVARQEREARDQQAFLEALARHEAAARIRKAQEAEDRRILRDQEKELRWTEKLAEKHAEKQKRASAIHAKNAEVTLQKSLRGARIVAFDGVLPSFLDEEYQYRKQASADFLEVITSDNQMRCMRD